MADPFEALRRPVEPVDPDPLFAARLRARLEWALNRPRGGMVPDDTLEEASAMASAGGVVPYLAVADARRALEWYVEALGARRRGDPIVMPDGRVGHAELEMAGGLVMLSDEHPELGVAAPVPDEGASVTLHLAAADVDAVVERAVAAGARLERPAADHPYGRNAVVRDPFGHRWLVSGPVAPAAAVSLRPGDVAYASLWVPDVERAEAFFAAVLGWRYAPGSEPQGRRVEGTALRQGLWGGQERATLFLCFAVEDVAAAVARVRAASGRAGEVRHEPYGAVADCVDDQGTGFALLQVAGGAAGHRRPAAAGHGDIVYLTLEVVDAAKARAFYGSVLGWRFTPGHVEDGWQVEGVVPRIGLVGGREQATVVPMYRVDDVAAAVETVRVAGGSATEPERQPYGVSSVCSDDQGTRFYLGQV